MRILGSRKDFRVLAVVKLGVLKEHTNKQKVDQKQKRRRVMLRWIDLGHLSIFYEKRQKNKTV